jgi:hypothetical protein
MQLIRCTTDRQDGTFDVLLQEDVNIGKDATVAFQSLSCTPNKDALTVGGRNDGITFQLTQAGGERRCELDVGTYGAGTDVALLTNITDRMNSVLRPTVGAEIGCQWQAANNSRKGTTIERQQGGLADFGAGSEAILKNATRSAGGVVSRSGGTVGQLDSFVGNQLQWGRGASVCRGRIERMDLAGAGNVIVGVTTRDPGKTNQLDIADVFGVGFTTSAAAFDIAEFGNVFSSGVPPAYVGQGSSQNPVIEIRRNNYQSIEAVIHQGGAETVLTSTIANYTNTLYPVVVLIGDDTARANLLRATPDPFAASVSSNPDPEDNDPITAPTPQFAQPTNFNRLLFESSDLAAWLGYRQLEYGPLTSTGTTMAFASEDAARESDNLESIIVESITLPLRSFNASYNPLARSGESSMLAVLAVMESTKSLVFNAPYLTKLHLRNIAPRVLRGLQFRLLRSDFTPLQLEREAVLTIILSDENDV